jgi:hypothetical protein
VNVKASGHARHDSAAVQARPAATRPVAAIRIDRRASVKTLSPSIASPMMRKARPGSMNRTPV